MAKPDCASSAVLCLTIFANIKINMMLPKFVPAAKVDSNEPITMADPKNGIAKYAPALWRIFAKDSSKAADAPTTRRPAPNLPKLSHNSKTLLCEWLAV